MDFQKIAMMEQQIEHLLSVIEPNETSQKRRSEIIQYAVDILRQHQLDVCFVGSTCFNTYLPESDIDLVVISKPMLHNLDAYNHCHVSSPTTIKVALLAVFNAFYSTIIDDSSQLATDCSYVQNVSTSNLNTRKPSCLRKDMTIRNIEFINARTSLIHLIINNANVDVTINQIHALASATFLEEVDRNIGQNHLFKRSILLIKVKIGAHTTPYYLIHGIFL
jgi:hypothetical protein